MKTKVDLVISACGMFIALWCLGDVINDKNEIINTLFGVVAMSIALVKYEEYRSDEP